MLATAAVRRRAARPFFRVGLALLTLPPIADVTLCLLARAHVVGGRESTPHVCQSFDGYRDHHCSMAPGRVNGSIRDECIDAVGRLARPSAASPEYLNPLPRPPTTAIDLSVSLKASWGDCPISHWTPGGGVFHVHRSGMAERLKMEIAAVHGICVATRVELPARYIWRARRVVLGNAAVPMTSVLEKRSLAWRSCGCCRISRANLASSPPQVSLVQGTRLGILTAETPAGR